MPNGKTKTYVLDGKTYTVPADTSMDELDQYIRSQSASGPRQIQDTSTISTSKPRSLLGRAEDWWTSRPAFEGTIDRPGRSPQEKFRAAGQGAAVASVPLLGAGLLAAPGATLLGLGGGALGGYAGSKAGSYLPDASELGSDILGTAGGLVGGTLGSKSGNAIQSAARKVILDPVTGKPTISPGPILERFLRTPEEAQVMIAAKTPPLVDPVAEAVKSRQAAWLPSRMPRDVDPVLQAVREGRAAKLPTRMPPTLPPPRPSTPLGMTSTAGPLGRVNPEPLQGSPTLFPQRNVQMVPKFAPPELPAPSRIIQPGTPEAQAPHVEGSYWSFREPQLRQAVLGGDRDAAIVYKQRFGELPSGAGYLTDVGQGPTRGLYRSTKP